MEFFFLMIVGYLTIMSCFAVVIQSLSCVWLFATSWTATCQASLSFTISQSLLKFMSIESVMPSNHLIVCRSLLLWPSIFPSIKVFSKELALHIMWPKYWSFSFSSSPSVNIQGWFPLGLTGLISLQSKELSKVFSSTTVWKHQFFDTQPLRIQWLPSSVVKNPPANAGDTRDPDSISGLRRSPGGGNGNPLQYSCLENPMDRADLWAIVHGVTKSRTQLSECAWASSLVGRNGEQN